MKEKRLFYGSSYDRALEHLLKMWPDIKKEVPDATLDICYGWNTFLSAYQNNAERMAWKDKMDNLMKQEGITDHGRVGQKELRQIRQKCGIWAYPTHFPEINCITALESQNNGLVPVTMALAALKETVGAGILVEGDIYLPEVRDKYKWELISLMRDPKRWAIESEKAREFAQNYSWDNIAELWTKQFQS